MKYLTKLGELIGSAVVFFTNWGMTFTWTMIASVWFWLFDKPFLAGFFAGWFVCKNFESIKDLIKKYWNDMQKEKMLNS